MPGPWDILGIPPTPDAVAIRRAYARALKGCRPDEDPEAFQRLVEARTRALAWHWPGLHEPGLHEPGPDDPGPDGAPDPDDPGGGIVLRLGEAEFAALLGAGALQEAEPDAPGRFDPPPPTDPGPHQPEPFARLLLGGPAFEAPHPGNPHAAGFAPPPDLQPGPDRLARLLRSLAGLLHGDADVQWDGPAWRAILREGSELDIAGHKRFRDAAIRDVLPRLPPVPPYDTVRAACFAGQGPAAAVDGLEAAFAFSRDQVRLATAIGQAATLRYLGWLGHARREVPPARRTPGQQDALALIARLTGTEAGMNFPARNAWRTEDCQRLLALLAAMPAGEREPCVVALLHGLAEKLPAGFDEAEQGGASGPAAAVALIEDALQLDGGARDAVPPGATLPPQYRGWLQAASRLRAARERRTRGAYRDARGIPLLPPEDAGIPIWSHPRFAAHWAAARRLGRWPLRFDWQAFAFPLTELASLGVRPGLGIVVLLAAGWLGTMSLAGLVADGPAQHWLATLCFAALVLARVPFAFLNRRLAILLAMRRIKRADRAAATSPRWRTERIRTTTLRRPNIQRAFELGFLAIALSVASGALTRAGREDDAYRNGRAFALQGRQADAIRAFDDALRLDPDDVRTVFARAVSSNAAGHTDDALAGFDRTLELDPQKVDALVLRARILAALKRFGDALRDDDKALQLRPGDPTLLNHRALVLQAMDDPAKAIQGFTEALARNPRLAAALVNRGRLFSATGDAGRALADFSAALGPGADATEAERESALIDRGWAYVGLGQYPPALADFSAAAKVERWRPDAERDIGFVQFFAGAFPEAADAFALFLQGRNEPYALLFWHLAQARTGPPDMETFADRVKRYATEDVPQPAAAATGPAWPYPVMQMFLGQISPDAMTTAAATDDQRCEAAFYAGEWDLLHAQPGPAATAFRAAEAGCPPTFIERHGAAAELGRLPPPPSPSR